MATSTERATISKKLEALIALTKQWDATLAEAAATNLKALDASEEATQTLIETTAKAITSAQELIDKVIAAGQAAETTAMQLARVNAQFQATSGGYSSPAMDLMQSLNANPFAASDYLSGASMLTTEQKAEFLRIIKDRDESGLNALLAEYKVKIDEIYQGEYQSIKSEKERLENEEKQMRARVKELQDREASGATLYYKEREELKLLKRDLSYFDGQYNRLNVRLAQYDQEVLRLEGQVSVLNRAWDDAAMQRRLESTAAGGTGKEAFGYTQEELLWLVNKALETGAGAKVDPIALTELIKKLDSAVPTKKYKLDLTAGDQKVSGFSDVDPTQFLEALLKARGTAI